MGYYDYKCRICGNCGTATLFAICSLCADRLDEDLYIEASQYKVAKDIKFWEDKFKKIYKRQEIWESFWRLVNRKKAFLTTDHKLGFR